jgi:hypothetical protein
MHKHTAQTRFFNPRALIALVVAGTAVTLVLLGFGTFAIPAATTVQAQPSYVTVNSIDPLVPPGFDCSKIHDLGIDKQVNFRASAIMIFCGEAQGGLASPVRIFSHFVQRLLPAPLVYGTTDVDLITGTETYPNITQSSTFNAGNPDNPLQIVVTYNDTRGLPSNIGTGVSVSTDGGNTFTRLTINDQSPFPNTGSPIILYNRPSHTWFIVALDAGCGGIGGYKSTTPWDPNSWTPYCIYNSAGADRVAGWADNNPSSPFYGRMYVSWNDFMRFQLIFVRYSTDNGLTWSNERQITNTFIRNVQMTGDLATGDVYVAGMNEGGGGFPHNDNNLIFRSTDGGNTWANTYTGPTFPGPGVGAVGYFAVMFPDGGGYWRHEGWGEPAALNGVVHLVYAQHGVGNDPGDVYYIRSTDKGETFSAPLKLNTDATTRPQWEPSLSVGTDGSVFATWYDARESVSCSRGDPVVPCYRMWARKSTDNGVTWLADDTFSDVISPLPVHPEPGIVADYVSDYDYASSVLDQHLHSWVDGRVPINGISQMDAFFDREPPGAGTPTPTPTPTSCSVGSSACGSIVLTPPTTFVINLSGPVDPATVQASDLTVNNIPANSFILSNNNQAITFHYNASPVSTRGLQTMHIPADAFNCGGGAVADFTCSFFYYVPRPTPTPRPRWSEPPPAPRL